MGSLSTLITDAFTIYSEAYIKIGEIGVEVVDLEGSPRQPRKINQLIEVTNLYCAISPSITLNNDGDEIIGVDGDVDTINNLLLKLKRAAGLYKLPAFPTPLTSFNFDFVSGGINVGPGQLGDFITNDGTDWVILNMGPPGTVPVATVNGVQWQSVVGNGIPSGGTTNQYLRKNSNTSYDVVWDTLTVSKITDITASAAELNILNGVVGVSTAEINFLANVNADIQNQFTGKLGTGLTDGSFYVGNGSGVATAVAPTGDVTFDNLGVFAITAEAIINADIAMAAAIGRSKLASGNPYRLVINNATGVMDEASSLTASRVLVSDANGIPTTVNVSTSTILFMDATSSVQTQLDNRLEVSLTSPAQGAMLYYNGTNWVNFAVGTNSQLLSSNGTIPVWVTDPPTGLPAGGTAGQFLIKDSVTDYDASWHTFVMANVSDVSTTSAELNLLSGLTVDSTVINFLENADSNIQDQINGKLGTALTTDRILVGVSDTATAVTNLPTAITIGGAYIYRVSGTDVTLADGGTGASLADPGADRLMFWDESNNTVDWLALGGNLSITGTTINATGGITNGAAANELMKSNGTNAISSGLFSSSDGNLQLGTGLSGSTRVISSTGSATNIALQLISKGNGAVQIETAAANGDINLIPFDESGFTQVYKFSSSTNNVEYPLRIRREVSGTPASGVGAGIQFYVETGISNYEIGSTIESVTTDVTGGSEDFDLVFKQMVAGAAAAESFRFTNGGSITLGAGLSSTTRGIIAGAVGADASLTISSKGSGEITLSSPGGTNINFATTGNYYFGTNLSGVTRNIVSEGSSSNITLALNSKGTGDVRSQVAGGIIESRALGAAVTNTVINSHKISSRTFATPAAGIGTGLQFETQTASAPNIEVGATIEAVTTDVTSTSEDFDLVFNTMAAGATAAERFRLSDSGAEITSAAAYYLGARGTDGTWRMVRSGDDLLLQQRESGSYVTKQTFSGA